MPILSISSKRNNGFFTPTLLSFCTILPGIDPIYVLLWPRISDSSLTPPKDILTNFLLVARAIDSPSEVFPTPGGPTRHKTGAFIDLTLFCTARYSTILSLTSSSP